MSVRKGNIGVTLEARIVDEDGYPRDVSNAATKEITVTPPSGSAKTFTASFGTDGTDGVLQYVTVSASDLDEAGAWRIEARVVGAGFNLKSSAEKFTVS